MSEPVPVPICTLAELSAAGGRFQTKLPSGRGIILIQQAEKLYALDHACYRECRDRYFELVCDADAFPVRVLS